MTIDTRQLRYFVAVAEEQHFGRAADRLRIAQPPLSQQIKQLEKSLGTPLIIRTTRNMQLTAAGELLLTRGRRILEEIDSLESSIHRVGAGLEGLVRLGFTGAATYGIMPAVVRATTNSHPGLALDVTGELLTPGLVAGLESHAFDVAVLRPPVMSDEIAHVLVKSERLVAAVPAASDLASRKTLTMSDFAEREVVSYPANSAIAQAVSAVWRDQQISPKVAQSVTETSTLLSLVAAGVGISLVPESATSIQIGGTVYVPVEDAPQAELAVAWRRNEETPSVLKFIPFLQDIITKL